MSRNITLYLWFFRGSGDFSVFYNYQQDYQQGFSLTAASSDAFFFNSHILNMNRPIHTESGRRETGLGLFCLPVVVELGRQIPEILIYVCLYKLLAADIFRKILYSSACTTFGGRHFQENPIFVCLYKFLAADIC